MNQNTGGEAVDRRGLWACGVLGLAMTFGGCSGTLDYSDSVATGSAALHGNVDGCYEITGTMHTVLSATGSYSSLASSIGEEIVVRYEFDYPHPPTVLGDSLTDWLYPVEGEADFSSVATVGGQPVESGCSHTTAFEEDFGQLDKIRVGTSSWSIQDWQSSSFSCQSNAIVTMTQCSGLSLDEPRAPHPEDCAGSFIGLLGFTSQGNYILRGDVDTIESCGASDSDGDGVLDDADLCPDTVLPDAVPTRRLGVNRFADVDGDGLFDTTAPGGVGPLRSYTLADTHGCSCAQIIDEAGLGHGHEKFGCSIGAMDDWVAGP